MPILGVSVLNVCSTYLLLRSISGTGVNTLGGFYYSEVPEPISMNPKPKSNKPSIALPLVSNPALRPIGLFIEYPLFVSTY